MSSRISRTERVTNLVLALLHARRPLPAEHIRTHVAGYGMGDEAFRKTFRRDRDSLAALGVPVREELTDEPMPRTGYRIDPGEYALPPISFTDDERLAVDVAVSLLDSADHALGQSVVRKLTATGSYRRGETGEHPMIRTNALREGSLAQATMTTAQALSEAIYRHRTAAFGYPGRGGGAAERRHVEPWTVTAHRGHWYLLGHDVDRNAPRLFRVTRIVPGSTTVLDRRRHQPVPSPQRCSEMVAGRLSAVLDVVTIPLVVRPGVGASLRLHAAETGAPMVDSGSEASVPAGVSAPTGTSEEWDILHVTAPKQWLTREVAALAPDAQVLCEDAPEASTEEQAAARSVADGVLAILHSIIDREETST